MFVTLPLPSAMLSSRTNKTCVRCLLNCARIVFSPPLFVLRYPPNRSVGCSLLSLSFVLGNGLGVPFPSTITMDGDW